MLESQLARLQDQNTHKANEMNQLSGAIAGLKDQLASAGQQVILLKQEAAQLQEKNKNITCTLMTYLYLPTVAMGVIRYDLLYCKELKVKCVTIKLPH